MRAEILTGIQDLIYFEREWHELALESAKSVFQMPGWIVPWWTVFGHQFELSCIAVFKAESMVGLAPLMIRKQDNTGFLQFIGTPLNDYNAFLAKPALIKDIGGCIFEYLSTVFCRWNIFEAVAVEQFEDTMGVGPQSHFIRNIHFQMLAPDPAPIIRLPSSWERYLASLPKDKRRSFEYLKRRLWREEEPEFEICTSSDKIVEQIENFEHNRLMSWRYRNRLDELPTLIRTGKFTSFLRLVGEQLPKTNSLCFAVLKKKDSTMIASGLYFSAHSRLLKYMQSWNYVYGHLSPGTVLDWLMIEFAIQQCYSIFDFGRGDEEYKFRFGAEMHQLQNAHFLLST